MSARYELPKLVRILAVDSMRDLRTMEFRAAESTGPSTAAELLALCGSMAIITSSLTGTSLPPALTGEEGNAASGRANLS
jgi:hypothetical protein